MKKINLEESKSYGIPMETGFIRTKKEETPISNNTEYRQAIVSLLLIY